VTGRPERVLLVDGDDAARARRTKSFQAAGFTTIDLAEGASALKIAPAWIPDVVLLQARLPDTDGFSILGDLKRDRATRDIPVILLAARGRDAELIRGLASGADECVTRTCSSPELIARVRALLRRTRRLDDVLVAGDLRLDLPGHRLTARGAAVPLRPVEFRLLHFFMSHAEIAHGRAQLLEQVWASSPGMDDRSVDVHIRRLRAALEPAGCAGCIQTVPRVGYRFSTREG
jgi:two-component system phosphate regulon response regulator PhoB